MADQELPPAPPATSGLAAAVAPAPAKPAPDRKPLDQYKVLLHNDDEIDFEHVIRTLMTVIRLPIRKAVEVTMEAHMDEVGLVTVAHQELAELYRDQLESKGLTATIEKA